MWIALTLGLLAAGPSNNLTAATPEASEAMLIAGTAAAATSGSFAVDNHCPGQDARQVTLHCERTLAQLRMHWAGKCAADSWSPRCKVVLHASRASYAAAVGRGGGQTAGSSWLELKEGKISRRRIDLLGEGGRGLAALPHEMTHLLLAELIGCQPPRWADEGIAILADSGEKQSLHQRDLRQALAGGMAFRVADLLTLEQYPQQRVAAFYGQSASLAGFLARREDPARFVQFVQQAIHEGYDHALQESYAIANVGDLERLWYADRNGETQVPKQR